jgi:hypothetical protein
MSNLLGCNYLSLPAVIQAAVNLQHIQGLKKSRPGFTSDITETSKCIHSSKDFGIQLVDKIQPQTLTMKIVECNSSC